MVNDQLSEAEYQNANCANENYSKTIAPQLVSEKKYCSNFLLYRLSLITYFYVKSFFSKIQDGAHIQNGVFLVSFSRKF
jgi:hypothetical protein